jgi:hypothetical protein
MLKSLTHAAIAATLLAATSLASATDADARGRGGRAAGIVAGTVIGLGILGAYAASRDRGHYGACYRREFCDVVGQRCWRNRYGERVCKDDVRCYTRRICD